LLVKGRTGCAGRISQLKHRYGGDRTRMDGTSADVVRGMGVLDQNLVKISGCCRPSTSGQRKLSATACEHHPAS
jgi:hypothetical protein